MNAPPLPNDERPHLFLLRLSGELSIKAKGTRNNFAKRLAKNVEDALRSETIDAKVHRQWARIFVSSGSPEAGEVLARVFGFASLSKVEHRTWNDLEELLGHGEELFGPSLAGRSFAVRARRVDRNRVPFTSTEVERALGSRLLPHAAGVDLTTPDVEVAVEIHDGRVYFSTEQFPGGDGLPVGSGGRGLALVSGGFDSIVAAWLLLRRGMRLDYVFCNLGGKKHRDATLAVLKILTDRWSYGSRPRLHIVDFKPLIEELEAKTPKKLWQVILKRQMYRAADRIARHTGAQAIVTGEAVAQVSSQTLQNLSVISRATDYLVLRPLAGTIKDEIFALARRIGSYELSAKVPEYCALDVKHPATHAHLKEMEPAEEGLEPELLMHLVRDRAVLDLRPLDLDKLAGESYEVEAIPEGSTVIDLRSPIAYKNWHAPDAVRLGYFDALQSYAELDRSRTYVFYCEIGLKSAHLAEVMRQAGYEAFHVKDGLKVLRRTAEAEDPALMALLSPVLRD